jgi:hypothetical protein
MIKKAGGRSSENRCVRCGVFWGKWNKRYFCITSDGLSISKGIFVFFIIILNIYVYICVCRIF